jgi:tetratricopeptide (TPR) repeat protein
VKWEDAPFHELLTYDFSDVTKDSAVLALSWEKKRIPMTLKTDTDANVVATIKDELHNSKGFQYQAWDDGVDYLLANNLDLKLALLWAETAAGSAFPNEHNYRTLSTKAAVLDKLGRTSEVAPLMDEALKFASAGDIHQYGRKLLAQGKTERALEIFKLNAARFPDQWPVNYGLARGYSAIGNYPAALEALLKAQTQVPDGDTVNPPVIKANIEKLKRGENIN